MATRVRSHAKINLGLAIGPVRPDGYHALATIYQTLAIHDFVDVAAELLPGGETSQIAIACTNAYVPCDARNTCWKIVELALERLQIAARVEIHIDKRLPVQGGLGAGSANAAAALIGLERELAIALPADQRLAIAAETGSDVPLFLLGGTVLGLGRGEQVCQLPDLPDTPCVLAVPKGGVSTPRAFRDWDQLQTDWLAAQAAKKSQIQSAAKSPAKSPAQSTKNPPKKSPEKPSVRPEIAPIGLTVSPASDRLEQLGRTWAAALSAPQNAFAIAAGVFPQKDRAGNLLLELVRAGIENDFEQVVFSQYPSLRDTLETLKNSSHNESAALYAALSGSGSALFGLYATEAASHAAVERLAAQSIPAFETKTIGRRQYWQDIAGAETSVVEL